jgi:hypothetical protein
VAPAMVSFARTQQPAPMPVQQATKFELVANP